MLDRLRELKAADPLAPMAVIVPTGLLATHISRALAEAGVSHANLHCMTLRGFAERLAKPSLARQGLRREPELVARLVLGSLAEAHADELIYFRSVSRGEGFHDCLIETIRDLKEAGVAPDDLRPLLAKRAGRSGGVPHEKLRELLLFWEKLETFREAHRLIDGETDLLRAAADAATESVWLTSLGRLIVYGIYDPNGLQRRLIAECVKAAPLEVYFPFQERAAYDYARPGLEWFESLGPDRRQLDEPMTGDGALNRLQARLFEGAKQGDTASGHDGSELLLVSAPGEAREAEEVVREILYPNDPAAAPQRYGVLLRGAEPYAALIHEALQRAGVTGYVRHAAPLAQSLYGRTLLGLAGLLDRRYRRKDVMDLLASAPLRPLDESAPAPPAAIWNHITIEAGVVEGRAEWTDRIAAVEEGGGTDQRAPARPWTPEQCREFQAFLSGFFDQIERVAAQTTWRGMADALREFFLAVVAEPSGDPDSDERVAYRQVLACLDVLGALDIAGVRPTPDRFRSLLAELLSEDSPRSGRFGRHEPAVLALMSARGVPFDVVILPGMVEKAFPRSPRQDPILLDAERVAINRALTRTGGASELPIKARRGEEERLLFTLAVQAARKRVVLTFPRLDPIQGRPRIPSWYLLQTVEAVTGRPCDFGGLDRLLAESPLGRVAPITWLHRETRDRAVHPLEYDLASFDLARHERTPDAMRYLSEVTPFFEQALRSELARFGTSQFTKYDGLIEDPELLSRLNQRFFPGQPTLAATRLETYAHCPFGYLISHVYGLEPLEEPERIAELEAMHRGALIHQILFRFFSKITAAGDQPVREAQWPALEAIARELFDRFERNHAVGYPLTWLVAQQRILDDLRGLLIRESQRDDGYRPALFELRFGMGPHDDEESEQSTRRRVLIELEDGTSFGLRGKIDRVDIKDEERTCRVFDYKTGRKTIPQKAAFGGGTLLQRPIYILAAEQLMEGVTPVSATLYYVSRAAGFAQREFARGDWEGNMKTLQHIVGTLYENIRAGRFCPCGDTTKPACCGPHAPGGAAAFEGFKWQADARMRPFLDLREIP